jgi:Chaperone of endosialidase
MTTQPRIIAAQTQFNPFTDTAPGLVPASGGGTTKFLRADASWQTVTGGATLSNDTSTNATRYPVYADATSGSMTTAYTSDTKLTYNPSTGTLSATVLNTLSDRRSKENIKPLVDSFLVINALQGVSFIFKESKQPSIGLIAQDVEKIIPEIVGTDTLTGIKSINYPVLVAHLIEYVKLLNARIETLENVKL